MDRPPRSRGRGSHAGLTSALLIVGLGFSAGAVAGIRALARADRPAASTAHPAGERRRV